MIQPFKMATTTTTTLAGQLVARWRAQERRLILRRDSVDRDSAVQYFSLISIAARQRWGCEDEDTNTAAGKKEANVPVRPSSRKTRRQLHELRSTHNKKDE
jgi:hypothetical protein